MGGGPSYTPDQLPRPLTMSEGAGCTCGMATGPSIYYTIHAHVAPDIPDYCTIPPNIGIKARVVGLNLDRGRNAPISHLLEGGIVRCHVGAYGAVAMGP
jgi:hypothetical protein